MDAIETTSCLGGFIFPLDTMLGTMLFSRKKFPFLQVSAAPRESLVSGEHGPDFNSLRPLCWMPCVKDPTDRHKVHFEGQSVRGKVLPEIFQKFISQSIFFQSKVNLLLL